LGENPQTPELLLTLSKKEARRFLFAILLQLFSGFLNPEGFRSFFRATNRCQQFSRQFFCREMTTLQLSLT
jgi:uncharacterized membrane protein